jgi:SAM-dependent methyltransferase
LTDPVPAWQELYIEGKADRPRPSFPVRLLTAGENLIDSWVHPGNLSGVSDMIGCSNLLIDTETLGRHAAVIGCGPEPVTIRDFARFGWEVVGIEPVTQGVLRAREFTEGTTDILQGTAERIPLADGTQSLVVMENVLEHVDSVPISLTEAYRILKPGGVLFVRTTNRHRLSLTGINWEFTTRYFNLFPRMVRESYVFTQLHYRPALARYSSRPAVHWFSFSDLCAHGRSVGFARFYSPYDLLYLTRRNAVPAWRFRISHWCRRQPWIRALAVSQMVGDIFMWKRHADGE